MMKILAVLLLLVPGASQASAGTLPSKAVESERLVGQIRADILQPWSRAWVEKDAAAFGRLCSAAASASRWQDRLGTQQTKGGISEAVWTASAPAALDRAALVKDVAGYLGGYSAVDAVAMDVLDLDLQPDGSAVVRARFDLRGRREQGKRRSDRGELTVTVRRNGPRWEVAGIAHRGFESVEGKPVFEDMTAKSGLDAFPAQTRQEAIRRGGYALALGDYDGDGWTDLFAGGRGPAHLYRNQGDGTYRDVTKAAGLDGLTMAKAAVFADFAKDGRAGLLVQRFVSEAGQELRFFKNTGKGTFVDAQAVVDRKQKHDRAMSMTAADFNGDGLIDLYVGYPGTRDFTDGRQDGKDGLAHQAIYLNRGGWKFEELAGASGPKLAEDVVRPHSALATDLAGNGRSDILVVDDRGNSSRLYLNDGAEAFSSQAAQSGLVNTGWGMVAAASDYDGDGKQDIFFTNIDLTAGHRWLRFLEKAGETPEKNPEMARLQALMQGNRLYRNAGDGRFRETTDAAGLRYAGEAPAGAVWVDYNNDGFQDLYVTNGLWSAAPDTDYSSRFIQEELEGADRDAALPDNQVMARLQKDGTAFAGGQRNRLFRNNGDGTFTEVGYVTGADRIEDGYVAAFSDYDKDGRVDLVLRNADPGTAAHPFPTISLLHNVSEDGNRLIAVHLEGTDGGVVFGARVTLTAAGKTQAREIRSVEGAVQNEAAAYFGIGTAAVADSLEVRWPSGKVDRYEAVKPGHLLIKEGEKGVNYLTLGQRPDRSVPN